MAYVLRCIHRHTIEEHPSCFAQGKILLPPKVKNVKFKKNGEVVFDPWWANPEYKIGYLDIETDNLKADFGKMLTWALKEKGGKTYYGVITKKEIFNYTFDKRIVEELLEKLKEFKIIVTYYGCLAPGSKILTSDLRYVPVETLKPGDKLLAFTENKVNGMYRYTESEVIHNVPIVKDSYKITLSNGKEIIASGDHKWLVKRSNVWVWKTTTELLHFNGKNKMQMIMPYWEDYSNNYYAGYLSAFIDGEGSLVQHTRESENRKDYTFQITFSQKRKDIINKLREALDYFGFKYNIYPYDKNHPYIMKISMNGGRFELLRLLAISRPAKLNDFSISKLGNGKVMKYNEFDIVSVEHIGNQVLMGLGTTSATYISDGFGSHNTYFDIPFIRTRGVYWGLDTSALEYRGTFHWDLWKVIRRKFKFHRNTLETATRFFGIEGKHGGKNHVEGDIWEKARYGDKKALKYVLDHNIRDVEILELLHEKVEGFSANARTSI